MGGGSSRNPYSTFPTPGHGPKLAHPLGRGSEVAHALHHGFAVIEHEERARRLACPIALVHTYGGVRARGLKSLSMATSGRAQAGAPFVGAAAFGDEWEPGGMRVAARLVTGRPARVPLSGEREGAEAGTDDGPGSGRGGRARVESRRKGREREREKERQGP